MKEYPDILLAHAIELAEDATAAYLCKIAEIAEILGAPIPPGTTARSWRVFCIEEGVAAANLWYPGRVETVAAAGAWAEAVALRWGLVALVEFKRRDSDCQGEAILGAYHAACLYDRSRGRRFVTYAKHWMMRAHRLYQAEMGGPARVAKEAYARGVRVRGEPLPDGDRFGGHHARGQARPPWQVQR